MSLLNIVTEQISQKFNNAKVQGTGVLAPRPGYYFIRSIEMRSVGALDQVPIAIVNWKLDYEQKFFEGVFFEIALSSLISSKPSETQGMNRIESFVNKTICISSANLTEKSFNGETKKALACLWHFVHDEPKFIPNSNLLYLSFGENITSKNYYQNLVKTAPYDVLEALEVESRIIPSIEIPIEGWMFEDDIIEDDGFDADTDDTESK